MDPKTDSIQALVSPMSIHMFAEVATTVHCGILGLPLGTSATAISYSLVPLALAAKHTNTLTFSWPVV